MLIAVPGLPEVLCTREGVRLSDPRKPKRWPVPLSLRMSPGDSLRFTLEIPVLPANASLEQWQQWAAWSAGPMATAAETRRASSCGQCCSSLPSSSGEW